MTFQGIASNLGLRASTSPGFESLQINDSCKLSQYVLSASFPAKLQYSRTKCVLFVTDAVRVPILAATNCEPRVAVIYLHNDLMHHKSAQSHTRKALLPCHHAALYDHSLCALRVLPFRAAWSCSIFVRLHRPARLHAVSQPERMYPNAKMMKNPVVAGAATFQKYETGPSISPKSVKFCSSEWDGACKGDG